MITYNGLIQLGFKPEVDFSLRNGDEGPYIVFWNSESPQPSLEEIEEGQRQWDAQEYARNRQAEYPPIGDQLDSLFHAGVFPADMAATLQAVKDKYPR